MRGRTLTGATDLQVVIAAVVLYLAGFFVFFPSTINVLDEVHYLEAAYAFSTGSPCLNEVDALSGERSCEPVWIFLPGTSALMAPFVALFGWRGAFLVPALALVVGTLATALWLRADGRSPLFALMVLGFPPALVLSRTGMSDVPSMALVAVGLWLFWTGGEGRRWRWLASGFLAGFSLSLREPNVLLFAPLYLGCLLRRERGVEALIAGGIVGTLLRPLGTFLVYGDPFYVFSASPSFALANVPETLPIYAIALLVFVPGGLIGGVLYRGKRQPEVIATIVLFVALYLLYGYHGQRSGLARSLILGPRYFAPLTPLLAFAAAETFPRLWTRLRGYWSRPHAADMVAAWGVRVWAAGVVVAAVGIHPAFAHLTSESARFREAIYANSGPGSLVVLDENSSIKFVNRLFGDRITFDIRDLDRENLERLLERHGSFTLALLDRSDSRYWRERARDNARKLAWVEERAVLEPLFDSGEGSDTRLRVWRVERR